MIGPPAGAAVAAGAEVAWALLAGVLLDAAPLAGVLLDAAPLAGVLLDEELLPLELLAGALLQAARTGVTTANTAIDLSNRRRVIGESLKGYNLHLGLTRYLPDELTIKAARMPNLERRVVDCSPDCHAITTSSHLAPSP